MRIALIAHDEMKPELIEFAQDREEDLERFDLVGTGTTGKRLMDATDLDVELKESGPQGGDLQVGAEVASGDCHAIIFLRDVLTSQPHEPDITALLRICDVHDIPLATNLASARFLLDGMIE